MDTANNSLWNSVSTEEMDYPEQIKFDLNKVYTITFSKDFVSPEENDVGNGPYCIFPVVMDGEDRVIFTSAISLIRAFKKHSPLSGKTLQIIKKMEGGRQYFVVNDPKELMKVTDLKVSD